MDIVMLGLLCALWLLIIYHHVIYPSLLIALAKRKQSQKYSKSDNLLVLECLPSISILIPAYNEAEYIRDKIFNLAALDYPADKLDVLVVCDGCTDDTFQIAKRACEDKHVAMLDIQVINQRKNSGKIGILNRYIPMLKGQIVALSDTSALLSIDALNICTKQFIAPDVSIVAGSYHFDKSASQGEDKYWQWQSKIKRAEASLGSPIGVHGALYFFRAADFIPLAADTINDDFILPMSIIAKGKRAVYCTNIIALELECASQSLERSRRVRIGAGNLQQLLRCAKLLQPKYKFTAFNFASGKALRALMPALLFFQILVCLSLTSTHPIFLMLAVSQLAGVIIAWITPDHYPLPKLIKTLFYALNGYRCALLGSYLYCAQKFNKNWH